MVFPPVIILAGFPDKVISKDAANFSNFAALSVENENSKTKKAIIWVIISP
jgi:hypothetical protein